MHREIQHNPEVPNTNITYKTLCVLDIFLWQIHFNKTYKFTLHLLEILRNKFLDLIFSAKLNTNLTKSKSI